MLTTKVFKFGNSQALRLPKKNKWMSFLKGIDMFTDDYMKDGRVQYKIDTRKDLIKSKI